VGRLAVVIPSVGSVEALESTLVSVLENRPSRCEILVVHAHPYDDPYQLAGEVRLIQAPPRASYVSCANLGFRESSEDVVHLLSAGCRVTEGWTEPAARHFRDPRIAVVAPLLIDERVPGRVVAARTKYGVGGTKRVSAGSVAECEAAGSTPIFAASLAAVFYNRLTLTTAGYLSTEVGSDLADVDLGLLLKHAGFQSVVEPNSQVYATEQPLEQVGAFRRAVYAERLFWRNVSSVGWAKSLAAHGVTVAADVASHSLHTSLFATLAGRTVGMAMVGSHRRHRQHLADLRNTAPVLVPASTATAQLRFHSGHATPTRSKVETKSRAA
jgi:hypothetical protein